MQGLPEGVQSWFTAIPDWVSTAVFFGRPRTLRPAQLVSRPETVPNFPCLQQLEINTWTKNEQAIKQEEIEDDANVPATFHRTSIARNVSFRIFTISGSAEPSR